METKIKNSADAAQFIKHLQEFTDIHDETIKQVAESIKSALDCSAEIMCILSDDGVDVISAERRTGASKLVQKVATQMVKAAHKKIMEADVSRLESFETLICAAMSIAAKASADYGNINYSEVVVEGDNEGDNEDDNRLACIVLSADSEEYKAIKRIRENRSLADIATNNGKVVAFPQSKDKIH
jgi:hypothetical protein